MAVPLVAGGVQPLPPDASTSLEELTSGIHFYLREMGQNVIEIGKRLILAKSLVRHGEWQAWLEDNFALSQMTANNFMRVAERFGKIKIDFNFGSTQMIQMLSLPEGEEEKFIEEQAAAGRIVAEMSVKTLRAEIQKYKAKLALVNGGVERSLSVEQASVSTKKVEKPVSSVKTVESGSDTSSDTGVAEVSLTVVENSKTDSSTTQNSLEQLFGIMKALSSGGNLQNLVEQSASKDIQALEGQLRQFAALYGNIQGYLAQWKRGKSALVDSVAEETSVVDDIKPEEEEKAVEIDVKAEMVEEPAVEEKGGDNENSLESLVEKICNKKDVEETDRHSILSALYQIALNDDENFTRTEYIRVMVKDMGFEVVHSVPTKNLYQILYFTALKFHIYT